MADEVITIDFGDGSRLIEPRCRINSAARKRARPF